ncbi:hypothetical protein MMB232_03203 [Brevundimonas subvibrioides]
MLLPDRFRALAQRVDDVEFAFAIHQRETRMIHVATNKPHVIPRASESGLAPAEPAIEAVTHSTLCRQQDFLQPWFAYWTRRIVSGPRFHRKLWEFIFICQGLWERGVLVPGARGLGFGVGGEPLPALFAAHGCEIMGTDLGAEGALALGWVETAQHAHEKESLRRPEICPNDQFDRLVSFQACDMNQISPHLTGFDFCWSSCAFEHLGSIEKGLRFVENSVECLKPGGWAIHTTEYNLYSNEDTLDNAGTVLFRRRDFEALAARLTAKGHRVAPLSFESGDGLMDNWIDVAPYLEEPSLKLALAGYGTTSFGIIVQRGTS